jgi:rhodanese-related sulfurtransferase
MTLPKLTPADARRLAQSGARLIDIRGRDEFARVRAVGAENRPLGELDALEGDAPVVFLCRSGMRTAGNAARLAACCDGEAYILDGGLDAWKAAGLPVEEDRGQPLELMRQVQIAAGSLVLIGVLLGFAWAPMAFALSAFVGAGLVMAGVTGWCGMARLLAAMPWNRRAA